MEVPLPEQFIVSKNAHAAAELLEPFLAKLSRPAMRPIPVPALFRTVALSGGQNADASWDRAAQYYLALAALHNAWKDVGQFPIPPSVRPALRDLGSLLAFPRGFDSPVQFRPEEIREQVNRLTRALK
jgi:hypothetical protein